MEQFPRIRRLPPYVFNITGELKAAARKRGEDVIDFGMGNPDQPTPPHIVEKMIETARRGDTHRYSVSKGIVRLRKAICNWYRSRYQVELDPDRDGERWLAVQQRLVILLPQNWDERRDRALAFLELGRIDAAIDDLEAYHANRPDADDAPAMVERLDALRRTPRLH